MKFKKILALSLSAALMMSAVPAYADEAELVTFEDSAGSMEENSGESVIFDESEYDEDTSEPENFDSVDEEPQMLDNDTDSDDSFLFSDDTDEIQMVGIAVDNTAPVIERITIDKHDVTVGDTVTVTAVITDESGIKDFPYIGFYMTESQSHTMYLKPQGNNIYKGSITITEDFVNGTYPAGWCNLEDIHSNGSTDYSFDQKYPDLYFCVTGAQEDTKAPVIESITIDKHDVTAGDTVTVTAVITDESGVKNFPYIGFYKTGSQSHTMKLKPQGNNIYKGSITITEDFVNGIYPAGWCNLEDIHSNGSTDYSFDLKYPDLYFRVLCDNHTWDEGTITQNATCTGNGKKQYLCTVCGATKIEVIPANGHKKVIDPAVSPTCESTGKTEGIHCSVCGEVIVAQNTIPATGHSWNSGSVTLKPTCENTGIKTYTCATCGKTQTETISALGHKEVTDSSINATCEADGKTEGSHCSVCGKVLIPQNIIPATGHSWDNGKITKDATCEIPGSITYTCTICSKSRTEVIAALGHKPVTDPAVAATCEADGKTEGSHCSVCNKILIPQNVIPATGHNWDNGTITKPATCEDSGTKTYTCTSCGKIKTETISALGHKKVTDPAVAATCEADGKTEGSHCSVCGKVFVEQAVINATGHKFGAWKTSSLATVFAPEKQVRTCSACGKKEQKEVGSKLQKTMKISATSVPLKVKQKTTALKVTGLAEGDSVISWKSNNTKIATVSGTSDGTCKIKAGKKTGKAKITITLKSGLQKTVTVSVQKSAVKTKKIIGVKKTLKLKKKQKTVLHPIIAPLTSTEKVTYKSSNSKVVTVNSKGQITAKKKGTATITVKSGSKSVKCKITVK